MEMSFSPLYTYIWSSRWTKLKYGNRLLCHSIESGYGATVVPSYSCIKLLDIFKLVGSIDIQRLNTTVTRYYSYTVGFPHSIINDGVGMKK